MTRFGPEFSLTTNPEEIRRRRNEADAILTRAERPTEKDLYRSIGLAKSTIAPPPGWTGYPRGSVRFWG